MTPSAAAPSRAIEDKPCARCGHRCSAHAPPDFTRMHCNEPDCSCNGYFPPKSYDVVVKENLALRSEIAQLKHALEAVSVHTH